MIGTLKIRVHAAAPQLPLQPCYTFVGSPSSIRVVDVPRTIGSWAITAVHVTFSYPDNSIVTADCVQTSGVWTGTIAACATSGSVSGTGVAITADGTDENGNAVTGYALGRGDLYVLAADATIVSDGVRYNLHYCESEPATPQIGDVHNFDGTFMYYNGTAWVGFGTGVTSINGQNGAVTLTGANIPVSGTDATTVAAALAGKRGYADLSYDVTTTGLGKPTTEDGGYFIVNGETLSRVSNIWKGDNDFPYIETDGDGYLLYALFDADEIYRSFTLSSPTYSTSFELAETFYTITGYAPSTVHDTLAKTSQLPTIDSALSSSSTNPVQNAVVTNALAAKANRTELCGAWAANTAYTTTSFVIHENAIYRCTTAHTSGASWDATEQAKWTSATIADVLAQYLPKSGGMMTGDLYLKNNRGAFRVENNVAYMYGAQGENATFGKIILTANGGSTDYATPAQTRYDFDTPAQYGLSNASCNYVTVAASESIEYYLPPPVTTNGVQQVRDLILYANVGTGGSVTFAATDDDGNAVSYVSDDFSALAAEDGLNAWTLTEITANTFLVKHLKLVTGTFA